MISYIKLIRPINILIIAVSQILIYELFIKTCFAIAGTTSLLEGAHIYLFVIDTIIIAAGGYIINGIIDQEADQNNNVNLIVGHKISVKQAWVYYFTVIIVGFIIAIYIALAVNRLNLLWIYPFATILLYLYSTTLKMRPLWGNLVVAIFCAFVPGIVWFAEYENILRIADTNHDIYLLLVKILIAYISMAFLATLAREIIKDLEDVVGDRMAGYRTLPIEIGVQRTTFFAGWIFSLLLISYILWFDGVGYRLYASIVIGLFMVLPTGWLTIQTFNAKVKSDYTKISKVSKYLMIISLFVFLLIPYLIEIN